MDFVALRRQNVMWSINQNPATINIKRTEKYEDNGGLKELVSETDPLTVRIFHSKEDKNKVLTHLVGTSQIINGWGLLANWQADIRADNNTRDEFMAEQGHFAVTSVHPQIVMGEVVGYQAALEVVS